MEINQGLAALKHPSKSKKNIWNFYIFLFFDYFFLDFGNLIYLTGFILERVLNPNENMYIPFALVFIFFPLHIINHLILDWEKITFFMKTEKPLIKVFFSFSHF